MTKSIICKDVFGNQYTVPVDELNIPRRISVK